MNTNLSHLVQTKDGLYRYQRKVPRKLQELLRRTVWNYSLGRDLETALAKRAAYKEEHDTLIERLKSGDPAEQAQATADAVRQRVADHLAQMERLQEVGPTKFQKVAQATPDEVEEAEQADAAVAAGVQNLWIKTADIMENCEGTPQEFQRLSGHLALAFGDQKYMRDSVNVPWEIQAIPPSGGGQQRMWDMLHKMLLDRLEEIAPGVPTGKEEERLKALMERYIKLQALKPNTQRHYRGKVNELIKRYGDHPLPYYTKGRLQTHRDLLIEDTDDETGETKRKASTVVQHFAPMKALWRWAADEIAGLEDLQFPPIRLPKPGETVDEIRWQSFDDQQIRRVWTLLNQAWGPEAKSKMKPSRRAAFLMTVRVMLYTGMRPAEVFKLDSSNVKGDVLVIRDTKTTGRRIPISEHIADLPDFLADGGFDGERGKTVAKTLSDNFTKIIRDAGFDNDRHVLYSLKDTLVERLQRQDGMSDDVIRGIIGHVGGQGATRHYKTRFGDTPHGMARMRQALDAVTYW